MIRIGHCIYRKRPIGRGTNSIIYRGYHRHRKRKVAIKKTRNAKKAWKEFRALRRIKRHKRITRCYGMYRKRGYYYLALSWVSGVPLGIRHRRRWIGKKYSWRSAVLITIRLLQTLSYMHRKSVFYQDINPSNILIKPRNLEIILIDFGSAAIGHRHRSTVQKNDVASAAYILAFLLTGNVPRYTRNRYPRIRLRRTPRGLQRIIRKATHPNAKYRYPTARSLARTLRRLL